MGLKDRLFGSPQDRFARRVLEVVKASGVAEAWYDAQEFAVRFRDRPDREPVVAYLANIFRECEGAGGQERDARIERFVRAMVDRPELPKVWAEVAPLLRPVLRVIGFGSSAGERGVVPLARQAFPNISEFVVIDQPDSMAYVTDSQPAEWGVSTATVFQTARDNLALANRPMEPGAAETAGGPVLLRLIDDGNSYIPSCLVLPGWLASFADRVGGRPLAFVPDTTGMLVTCEVPDGMAGLFGLVEQEYTDAPRSMFPVAFTVDDAGNTVPYRVAPGHPAAAAAHRAECLLAAEAYGLQLDVLNAGLEDGVFAAGLMLAQRPDGSVFTVATWAEGVDSLLPQADYVVFSNDSGSFFVPWDIVADEVAPLLPVEGVVPQRFRVRGWPPPATLQRLRMRAVQP